MVLEEKCQENEVAACENLAWVGINAGNDRQHAKKLKVLCEEKNYLAACIQLGSLELDDDGKDLDMAYGYFFRACEGDLVQGCFELARLRKDQGKVKEAKALFKRVCQSEPDEITLMEYQQKEACEAAR